MTHLTTIHIEVIYTWSSGSVISFFGYIYCNKGDVHKVRSKNNALTSFSGVSNESKVL